MLFLCLIFEFIKSITIYANHCALADKGIRVYLADKAENGWSLALLGKHEEHLHILTGIETAGIHHRYSPIGISIDALAYLLILLRNDEELYTSTATVHHLVDAECLNTKNHLTI